jgi:alkylmercury lyase
MGVCDTGYPIKGSLAYTEEGRKLYQPLLKRMALGSPVERKEIAALLGRSLTETEEFLKNLPAFEFDEEGRLVGAGLSLRETTHLFEVEGQRLFTWCALDTLFFPAILEKTARVTSTCAATGTPIRLTVSPQSVLSVEPEGVVVSLVWSCDGPNVRNSFCNRVHFFASADAARDWHRTNPEASVVPLSEAFSAAQSIAQWILA